MDAKADPKAEKDLMRSLASQFDSADDDGVSFSSVPSGGKHLQPCIMKLHSIVLVLL